MKNSSYYYGYNITKQLLESNFVEVYGFKFEIDEQLPKDLKKGDYIAFDVVQITIEWI